MLSTITEPVQILHLEHDEPRVSSELIAQRLGVEHEAVMKHITSYTSDFESFGAIRFQIGSTTPNNPKPPKFALLNEQQCYLLFTYSRNTDQARALKMAIIAAFTARRPIAAAIPQQLSKREILELALEAERRAEQLEARVLEDAPKVQAFEQLMDSSNLLSIQQAAKVLGWGQNRLFKRLRDDSVLMNGVRSGIENHNVPYQRYQDAGYFEVKISSFSSDSGRTILTTTTRVTARGLEWLRGKLERAA